MTKLDIYCGMLGVGKTTVIKQMLSTAYRDSKIAIIENEVGQVNLDAEEFKEASIAVKELSSGCICCTVKGDFSEGIDQLVKQENPDYILVEPSGVADIRAVIEACTEAEYAILNRVVMIVNTKKVKPLLAITGEFFTDQIRCAETIYLNFTEKLADEKIIEAKKLLKEINPNLTFVDTPLREIGADTFPDKMYPSGSDSREAPSAYPLGKMISGKDLRKDPGGRFPGIRITPTAPARSDTYDHIFEKPFTEEKIAALFLIADEAESGSIWRMKGYFQIEDGSVKKMDYSYGDRFIERAEGISVDKQNHLVVIGKNMDIAWLRDRCRDLEE